MTTARRLNVSAWNLAFAACVLGCQDPPSATTEDGGGDASGSTTDHQGTTGGTSGGPGPGCVTEGCAPEDSTSSTGTTGENDETGDTTGSLDRCGGDEDCSPGSLCEVYDDGYTTMPYADCWGYDIYRVESCAEVPPVRSIPLPSADHDVVSLSFVDVDGDGRDDLIAGLEAGAAVLYGPGDGTFRQLPLPAEPIVSTAAADFDGDGRGDIVALSQGGQLTLLFGQDGGGWVAEPGPEASGADRVFALDLVALGTDLALFDADAGTLTLWTNTDGEFSLFREIDEVEHPVSVGPSTHSDREAVFHAKGSQIREVHGVSSTFLFIDRASPSMGFAQLDLGAERPAERVVTSYHPDWTLIQTHGWNEYDDPVYQYLPSVFEHPQAADLDGDGVDELVLESAAGLAVLAAQTKGSGFSCLLELRAQTGGPWALGDFNGDGRAGFVSADGAALLHQSLPAEGTLTPR